jgi:hypothetical protein
MVPGVSDWISVNPTVDKLFDEFAAAEIQESGLPISKLVKPAGNDPIMFGLHYAPEHETAFQEFGVTPDASEPCIRVMATKMSIPCEASSLLAPGLWMELCFRRCIVPPHGTNELPHKVLGEDVLAIHFALRMALWQTCGNPLGLLLGKYSYKWFKSNIQTLAIIPYSQTKIFGKRASLYIEADQNGNVTRITLPVLHPENAFYSINDDAASLNDLSWNFVLACAVLRRTILVIFDTKTPSSNLTEMST